MSDRESSAEHRPPQLIPRGDVIDQSRMGWPPPQLCLVIRLLAGISTLASIPSQPRWAVASSCAKGSTAGGGRRNRRRGDLRRVDKRHGGGGLFGTGGLGMALRRTKKIKNLRIKPALAA
jgi:hypothetical protein